MKTCVLSSERKALLKSRLKNDYKDRYNQKSKVIDAFIDNFRVSLTNTKIRGNWSVYDLQNDNDVYGFVQDFIVGDLSKRYYTIDNITPQESVEMFND